MHKSAEELFAAALELTNPIERVALLDRECAGNPELRAEVESLLAAHEQAGTTFINEPAASQATVLAGWEASSRGRLVRFSQSLGPG